MNDEVVIIGGGFAGLAAAVTLAEQGRRVRLFEQNPHLGGRARSFRDAATGSVVDNGQHILMGCYHSTLRFLRTIGTSDKVGFQNKLRVDFLESDGRATKFSCPRLPSPWHLLAGVLLSPSFSRREKMEIARLGRALESGKARLNGFERMSVAEWLAALGQSEGLRRNFWDLLSIAAMNEEPARASAVLFERVLRLALFTSPSDSRIGIPLRGLSECFTPAAENFIRAHGGSVECGRRVAGIVIDEGRMRAVRFSDSREIEAASVISAVPWFVLGTLLPPEVRAGSFFSGLNRLEPAPIISINMWFDRPVTELNFAGLRGTTIQWLFRKAAGFGPGGAYLSIVLSGAHAHVNRSRQDLEAMALRELRELLPAARQAKVVRSMVIKERFATFSPKPGTESLRPPARTPVRGLYLAGDWTATGLPATIEGAVQSGYAAAESVTEAD